MVSTEPLEYHNHMSFDIKKKFDLPKLFAMTTGCTVFYSKAVALLYSAILRRIKHFNPNLHSIEGPNELLIDNSCCIANISQACNAVANETSRN